MTCRVISSATTTQERLKETIFLMLEGKQQKLSSNLCSLMRKVLRVK